jgi:hypothetical protein
VEVTRLTQIAEDLARRGRGRVLDYETPPPSRTASDVACEFVAWCRDTGSFLTFCLGLAAMVAGGSVPGWPKVAGALLTASVALLAAATVRWAYGRSARW